MHYSVGDPVTAGKCPASGWTMTRRLFVSAGGRVGYLSEPFGSFLRTRAEPFKVTYPDGESWVAGTDIEVVPFDEALDYEAEFLDELAAFQKLAEKEHKLPQGALLERFRIFDDALSRAKTLAAERGRSVDVKQCAGWHFVVVPETNKQRLYRLQQEEQAEAGMRAAADHAADTTRIECPECEGSGTLGGTHKCGVCGGSGTRDV